MSLRLSSCLFLFLLLFHSSSPAQVTLNIAAAADLAPLQPALSSQFEKTNPNRVRFVMGASATLAQQIENGAPFDVFLSANAAYVDRLSSFGKLQPTSVRIYAVGRVGIVWRDNKRHSINDLAQNWVRFVGLANPKLAPYGVAAQQALEHAGLWQSVQPKVVYGENVRQALQLFTSGNADAVLTSASLLEDRDHDLIPAAWHQPILQKGGMVASSSHLDAARQFLNFLTGPAGQEIFARFGFGSPPKP